MALRGFGKKCCSERLIPAVTTTKKEESSTTNATTPCGSVFNFGESQTLNYQAEVSSSLGRGISATKKGIFKRLSATKKEIFKGYDKWMSLSI
ncbi:hypothetical protein HispidOSU_023790, partial [Sigmodon hispidus]